MNENPLEISTSVQTERPFYGWWNVLAAFLGLALSYAMFTVFAFGTFLQPLAAEFGWQRGEMSFALTITNLVLVVAAPLLGGVIDKFGVRRVLIPSIVLMGAAVASMSLLTGNIWHFYTMYLLIPLLGAGTLPLSYSRVLIAWFEKKRGIAIGVALAGFGVGAALVPSLSQWLIDHYGWRQAYIVFGGTILCINLPLALLLQESPSELGQYPDGDANAGDQAQIKSADDIGLNAAEAVRTRNFWLILGSFVLVGIGITSLLAHLVPMLIDRGIEPQMAAFCMTLLGVGLIFGRVLSGYLMDRYFAPYVAATFLLGLIAGIIILATGADGPIIYLAAILIGLATGSEIGEIAYIVSRYFGAKAFGLIYGITFGAFQLGSAFGPPILGLYFDRVGNYLGALWVLAAIVCAGTLLIAILGKYPDLNKHPR